MRHTPFFALLLFIAVSFSVFSETPSSESINLDNSTNIDLIAKRIAGKYTTLDQPLSVPMDGTIHIEEIFWYGCPHCYQLEKLIDPWSKSLAKDITFTRIPAALNAQWAQHAQLFYIADMAGVLEEAHSKIFAHIHNGDRIMKLLKPRAQKKFLMRFNADESLIEQLFDKKSFNGQRVQSFVNNAKKRVEQTNIDGVPIILVHGKYLVSGRQTGGQKYLLPVVNDLILLERAGFSNK